MRRVVFALIALTSWSAAAVPAATTGPASDRVKDAVAAATQRFDQSPTGAALRERQNAAESRLARARDSGGGVEERTSAAQAALEARQAYRAALQRALDGDPDLLKATREESRAQFRAAAEKSKAEAGAAARASKAPRAGGDVNPAAPMNAAIVAFARQSFGKQIGNGECWTLADKALKVAGAKAPDVYVWGRALDPAKDEVIPGDLIQFTKVRVEKDGMFFNLGTPNHTAIVERVVSPGVYQILHQNAGVKTVTEMTIDVSTKTAGELVIYRPIPGNGYKATP